jgi:hypothetical protein
MHVETSTFAYSSRAMRNAGLISRKYEKFSRKFARSCFAAVNGSRAAAAAA